MSFTVTPNCSVLVTNTNNEDGDGCPHKYWTIYYCFSTSWTNNLTDMVLLMVFMQWINRWYKLPVKRGWREQSRFFCYMWTQNSVQILSLNFKLFLELLNVFIWRTLLSFFTSLLAHCWKFLVSHRDPREFLCMDVREFLWALGADRPCCEGGDWARAGLGQEGKRWVKGCDMQHLVLLLLSCQSLSTS